MIKRIFFSCLIIAMMASPVFGLDLTLEPCLKDIPKITDIKFVPDGNAFITTQLGDVYWFNVDEKQVKKIAEIDVATSSWELGLYSVAVAPDFNRDPKVFLYYAADTDRGLVTRLSVFKVNGLALPNALSEEKILMEIEQPYTNGNGGALEFGPDGLLYLGVGDGGSEGDPSNNAQNVQTILGSIVRIKPDLNTEKGYTIPKGNLQEFVPNALPEIFAYGVRNPWKAAFDTKGDLIIGDVGEHLIEEVDVITKDMIGTQKINLGWNFKEGNMCFDPSQGCGSSDMIDPVYQYEHGDSGNSITGGKTILFGGKEYYLFADYMTGMLGALDLEAPQTPAFEKVFDGKNWTTFGKDPYGRIFVADYTSGTLYQIKVQP